MLAGNRRAKSPRVVAQDAAAQRQHHPAWQFLEIPLQFRGSRPSLYETRECAQTIDEDANPLARRPKNMPEDKTRIDQAPDRHWSLLLTELQSSQCSQGESGDEVDEILIARYLAGKCSEDERQEVENAARSSPEVRECIDIARDVLLSEAAEKAVPITPPAGIAPSVVRRRRLPAAILKWAVAASLLALLAGGAYTIACLRSDLKAARSDLAAAKPNVPPAKPDLPAAKPDSATALARIGMKIVEQLRSEQKQDQQKQDQKETIDRLRKEQELLVAKLGLKSSADIESTLSTLQQGIKVAQAQLERMQGDVTSLKGPCGGCQSPTPRGNVCMAYCSPCPCSRPSPCVPQPSPCAGGCAVPCQSAARSYATPLASASYGSADSWTPARRAAPVAEVTPLEALLLVSSTPSDRAIDRLSWRTAEQDSRCCGVDPYVGSAFA